MVAPLSLHKIFFKKTHKNAKNRQNSKFCESENEPFFLLNNQFTVQMELFERKILHEPTQFCLAA